MYYKLEPHSLESCSQSFSLDGELVGTIQEADTSEGYIKQFEYSPDKKELPLITKQGRVDYLGNCSKDSPKVINDRLNKVRAELGLAISTLPQFLE